MKRIFLIVAAFGALLIVLYLLLPYLRPGEKNLVVSGRIEADEINLSARIPRRVKHISIEDGSAVRKGEVIATIEDDELRSKSRELQDRIIETPERIKAAEHTPVLRNRM